MAPGGRREQGAKHFGAPEGMAGGAQVTAVEVVPGAALVPVDRQVRSAGPLRQTDDLVGRDEAGVDLRRARRRHRLAEQ